MSVRAALFLSLALLPAAPLGAERVIAVTGRGEVTVPPDMAVIRLGVVKEGESAATAMAAANDAAAGVLDRLAALDIAAQDIQTSALRLAPVRSETNGARRVTGYRASNEVTVQLRDLDALGATLDAVVAEGADTFDGLRFTLADPGSFLEEARRAAVADAMDRAATLAEAAGVALGPVGHIAEENGRSPRPMMMEAARADSAGAPVAPGEIEMSVTVSMEFAIGAAE